MAYKIKNPKNVRLLVEHLRRAELDIQNLKRSATCPLTAYNAALAEENLARAHKCLAQAASDLGVNESELTEGAIAAWPGGK